MLWQPPASYRRVFKLGMRGTDVAALQLNLGDSKYDVVVDGVFGPATKAAVKRAQRQMGITVDGIAGLATQQRLIERWSRMVELPEPLPTGLLKSLAANESGFAIAAYSPHPSDPGYDLGAFQRSLGSTPNPPQDDIINAYSIKAQATWTGEETILAARLYSSAVESQYLQDIAEGNRDRFRWQLAILHHNWPVAAQNIATRGYIYPANTDQDDTFANWIITASGGRLTTPRQWVAHYIEAASVYIAWGP